MTKEELSEKRNQAIKSINDVEAILGLDEMYSDELEKENAELKKIYHESDEDNIKLRENIPLLAEAKELLEICLSKARGNITPSWSELIADIEQFLSRWRND